MNHILFNSTTMGKRIPIRAWLGFQSSIVLLVGGNHTSSRVLSVFCFTKFGDFCPKMDFKALKWHIVRGSLTWRLILRTMFFVLAILVLSFTRIANEIRTTDPMLLNFDKCSIKMSLNIGSVSCVNRDNFTVSVIREVMNHEMLSLDASTLCVGEGSESIVSTLREFGFSNAFVVHRNPILSLWNKPFEHKLDFESNSFDFVFSRTFDRASVPALVVLEIERVLRPGGVGAILVGPTNFHTRSLVRSATPVSLLLRSSEIIHVCGISSFTLIVFKKQLESVALFDNYKLPNDCPAVSKNKPFMQYLEPVVEHKSTQSRNLSYLPKFTNIATRNRLIYINMGAGEFDVDYPIHPDAFNVYVVDHNVSALTSHVNKAGVTFVYHPGLVEDDKTESSLMSVDYLEAPLHEEQFEFIDWFKETVKDGDFVVLMMNAGVTQLKVLNELFASGAICHVDELFLRCSDGVDCRTSYCRDCVSLFNGLRNAGVFVHQWFGE
ncbi:putative methyltransferase type 11, S-adenosyl-L-methionine-dependent methyltransferase [Helianthus annuus]|uniref:Methyltransferase type 11, S-adenosyl-L-methionine-dependent methyltransferase n=3 Tax=Helianthus annuus TaxID=4232 RepID=A0A9K3EK41_HELAN|nr:putative methyltransferase type 11, S-adenosyl-L-methionine-dependent methyltransferase [Helianthus annuus]KAJ0497791.1 putative methyltransferase type 11, S-adenosyl-L-methionine-dependent methyltransferase [Helianthus annuus]KAJ0671287.1 putative methyltransferase type 11, S-adenosyl-L-methionine-dependent methyltransferase [Helianthus annuus]